MFFWVLYGDVDVVVHGDGDRWLRLGLGEYRGIGTARGACDTNFPCMPYTHCIDYIRVTIVSRAFRIRMQ